MNELSTVADIVISFAATMTMAFTVVMVKYFIDKAEGNVTRAFDLTVKVMAVATSLAYISAFVMKSIATF